MLSVDVPKLNFTEVPFQPEAEYRKTLGIGSAPPLLERLSIAQPVVVGLRPEQAYADPRVAEFFAAKSDQYHFSLVRLACGFAPEPDEPITMAVLEVALTPGSGQAAPIVVDMDPSKIADASELKRDLEGGVNLEVAGGKLGFTIKQGTEQASGELFVVAAGIGQPRVGWEIRETKTIKVGGILVFNLILQTNAGQTATGRVSVSVEVRRKRFGLIPYRALLDQHPTGQFQA